MVQGGGGNIAGPGIQPNDGAAHGGGLLLDAGDTLPAKALPGKAGRNAEGMNHQNLLRRGGVLPANGGIEIILVMIEDDAGKNLTLSFQHPQGTGGQGCGGGLPGGIDPQRPVGSAAAGFGFVGEQFGIVRLNGI